MSSSEIFIISIMISSSQGMLANVLCRYFCAVVVENRTDKINDRVILPTLIHVDVIAPTTLNVSSNKRSNSKSSVMTL